MGQGDGNGRWAHLQEVGHVVECAGDNVGEVIFEFVAVHKEDAHDIAALHALQHQPPLAHHQHVLAELVHRVRLRLVRRKVPLLAEVEHLPAGLKAGGVLPQCCEALRRQLGHIHLKLVEGRID
eukprot:5057111-Pyramimonas_sp.AAC.1